MPSRLRDGPRRLSSPPRSPPPEARTCMTGVPADHAANPFAEPAWTTPHGLPPFERIAPAHYEPAFERALGQHVAEIEAIAGNSEPPTFANTVEALERAGEGLRRVASTFFNL